MDGYQRYNGSNFGSMAHHVSAKEVFINRQAFEKKARKIHTQMRTALLSLSTNNELGVRQKGLAQLTGNLCGISCKYIQRKRSQKSRSFPGEFYIGISFLTAAIAKLGGFEITSLA